MTNTLFIDSRQFNGMELPEAVSFIMANRAITKDYLINDITVLGGIAPEVKAKKAVIAEAYVATLVEFVKAKRAEAKEANQCAMDESSVAQQTTNNKEELTMTNNNQTVGTAVTTEVLTANLTAVAEGIIAQFNTKVDGQSEAISMVLEQMNERINNSARYTQALEAEVKQLKAASQQATVATPVAEAPVAVTEAPVVLPQGVDPNQVVFTDDQIAMMERMKRIAPQMFETMKSSYESTNRLVGHTVGGFLNGTAMYIDEVGHKGVDSVADFIDTTIDTAKGLVVKTVEFAADTAHTVTGVGRNLGHLVINGTVYTLNSAGQLIERK